MKKLIPILLCICMLTSALSLTALATDQTETQAPSQSATEGSTGSDTQVSTESDTQGATGSDTQVSTESDTQGATESDTQEGTESDTTPTFTMTSLPYSAGYLPLQPNDGVVAGTITVTMPEQYCATSLAVYWGTSQDTRLGGYGPLVTYELTSRYALITLGESSVIPAGATCMLVYTYSEQFGECIAPYKIDLPKFTLPATGKKLSEFVVVSDLHIGSGEVAEQNFLNMLKDVKRSSPGAAGIIVVGSAVDAADQKLYTRLNELCKQVPDAPPVYYVQGDHEFLSPDTHTYDEAAHASNLQLFLSNAKLLTSAKVTTPYYSCTFASSTVVVMGADSYEVGNAFIGDEQLLWLESTIKKADSKKPVFVFMHEPLLMSVSGTMQTEGFAAVYNFISVQNIIEQYPNVVMFNGHSHSDLHLNRTMHQFRNGAHAFNAGAIAHLRDQAGAAVAGSQGLIVTVYEDAVLVRGRDFATGEWLANDYYQFSIKKEEVTTKAPATTSAGTEASSEEVEEEPSLLSELALPLFILGCMAVIVFILVFRKPKGTP